MAKRSAPRGDDEIVSTHGEPNVAQIATQRVSDVAAEVDSPEGGIIPSHMSKDWQDLRSKLRQVSVAALAGAASSTTEEAARCIGLASAALMDADFIRRRIERGTDHTNGSQA